MTRRAGIGWGLALVLCVAGATAASAATAGPQRPDPASILRWCSAEQQGAVTLADEMRKREIALRQHEEEAASKNAETAAAQARLDARLIELTALRAALDARMLQIDTVTQVKTDKEIAEEKAKKAAEDAERAARLEKNEAERAARLKAVVQMVEANRAATVAPMIAALDPALAVDVLNAMKRAKAGKVLTAMAPAQAAALAEKMARPIELTP